MRAETTLRARARSPAVALTRSRESIDQGQERVGFEVAVRHWRRPTAPHAVGNRRGGPDHHLLVEAALVFAELRTVQCETGEGMAQVGLLAAGFRPGGSSCRSASPIMCSMRAWRRSARAMAWSRRSTSGANRTTGASHDLAPGSVTTH